MLNLHDVVVTTTKFAKIPEGTIGTIIYSYIFVKAYEVEFIINETKIVETVLSNYIRLKIKI